MNNPWFVILLLLGLGYMLLETGVYYWKRKDF
jgi:hypothetical protein